MVNCAELQPNVILTATEREIVQRLVRGGFGMRNEVPFGTDWYPCFTRSIAERPANHLFVPRQIASS